MAIGYDRVKPDLDSITVREFTDLCKQQEGKTYYGYKGGEYTMDLESAVYISNYGECEELQIKHIGYIDNPKSICLVIDRG